ncbi:hypothetical protein [Hymenobacter cellulosivorans]|uniref:HEAT repeat domain-containing protein n=1 Tax=Hymenobacter cellulosivorans TaxID=2932249 RepID=A0ABY4F8H9_9BACT|nr:hypothetical protein [Hymenobacter cellulosivorans]UOQ52516.1 hypothetical protein MUN80_22540 [Hymenobacter cellulosivorans]
MRKKARFEHLQAAVFSGNWTEATRACDQLLRFGGGFNTTAQRKSRRFLLGLLTQDDALVRNAAALAFRKNKGHWAVSSLLRALLNPANAQHRGTLAYALEKLKCRRHLGDLFTVLFSAAGNNWQVQMHILTVLETQRFTCSPDQRHAIRQQWEHLRPDWNRLNNLDETSATAATALDALLIQSFVDELTGPE